MLCMDCESEIKIYYYYIDAIISMRVIERFRFGYTTYRNHLVIINNNNDHYNDVNWRSCDHIKTYYSIIPTSINWITIRIGVS